MNKALILADLHLTINPSEEYRHGCLYGISKRLKAGEWQALIVLGDLTEHKDHHPATLVNRVVDHLANFAQHVPVLVSMGNHDYLNEGSPYFKFVDHIDNLHWIDTPTDGITMPEGPLRKILRKTVILPHTRNHERDWANVYWDNFDYALAHQTFTGAETAQGHRLEGIPLEYFPRHLKIISGDIHTPQQFGNLMYVGSPYTVDFGDDFTPRGLTLDDEGRISDVVLKGPQKMLVHIGHNDPLPPKDGRFMKGDVLKIRVDIDDMGQWAGIRRTLMEWGASRGLITYRIEPVLDNRKGSKRKMVQHGDSVQSDADVLRAFGKRNEIAQPLMDMGLDIIKDGSK